MTNLPIIITKSFKETQKLGEDFSTRLKAGDVIALYGNLGSGKTTFMQGLAKGLGIKRNIISPTFIILRTYETIIKNNISSNNYLYHLDLYRIENESEVNGLGLFDIINRKDGITAIEWPDKVENVLPDNRINIYFEYIGDNIREIRIS